MTPGKNRIVTLTVILLGVSFVIFFATGYTALYWARAGDDVEAARP